MMSHYNRGPIATAQRGVTPSAKYGGGDVVIRDSSYKCRKSQKFFKKLQKKHASPCKNNRLPVTYSKFPEV